MALELLRHGAYSKRKRRWVRAHHGGVRRREHVRARGAAIVGTSGERRSAVSGVGKRAGKSSQAEGQQCGSVARPVNRPGILVVTSGRWLTAAASQGRLAALAPDSDRLAVCAVNPRPLAV